MADKDKNNKSAQSAPSKQVIDGLPCNAFRVVGVAQDVVLETFYLYPNFPALKDQSSIEFNLDPDPDTEPNLRLVMSREVAARLTNALFNTLNAQAAAQLDQGAEQPAEEPAAV